MYRKAREGRSQGGHVMNRTCRIVLRTVAGTSLVALGLAVACTSRRGVEPEPAGYNIYVGLRQWEGEEEINRLYAIDADSLTIVDSMPLSPTALGVSPDGEWLYVEEGPDEAYGPFSLSKVDLRSKEVVWAILPWFARVSQNVAILNGGSVLLGTVYDLCALAVISAADGAEVFRIDGLCRFGDALISSTKIPYIVKGEGAGLVGDSIVRAVDVVTGQASGKYVGELPDGRAFEWTYNASLHPDGHKVLVLGGAGVSESGFAVGDLETGETLLSHSLYTAYGEIAISADGTLAVVSDPGPPGMWNTPPTLDVFDLAGMCHLKRFDTGSGIFRFSFGQIRFLPDDRTVVIAPASAGRGEVGPLHIIDLQAMIVTDTIVLPHSYPETGDWPLIGALGVGPRP